MAPELSLPALLKDQDEALALLYKHHVRIRWPQPDNQRLSPSHNGLLHPAALGLQYHQQHNSHRHRHDLALPLHRHPQHVQFSQAPSPVRHFPHMEGRSDRP